MCIYLDVRKMGPFTQESRKIGPFIYFLLKKGAQSYTWQRWKRGLFGTHIRTMPYIGSYPPEVRILTGRILSSQGCKILIRPRGCVGWFESSLDAFIRRYVLSRCGSTENTQRAHNIETTSIQRQGVESTLFQRCVPLGTVYTIGMNALL